MKTRRSLKPDDFLLIGRLAIEPERSPVRPSSPDDDGPYLGIAVFCPRCRIRHWHGWPGNVSRSDLVSHVSAPCINQEDGWAARGYWIALDDSIAAHNRQILKDYRRRRAAWEARRDRARAKPTARLVGGDGASLTPVGNTA